MEKIFKPLITNNSKDIPLDPPENTLFYHDY